MSDRPFTSTAQLAIHEWVVDALQRVPMPDVPVQQPWAFAPSALVAPHLPGPLARVPGVLDRFGAIRLSPFDVGIDMACPVPWHEVVEVRTRPLLDLLTETASGSAAALGARLLPPVPLVGKALTRAGSARAAEAMRALLQVAASAHAERAAETQVPAAIVYRSGRRGRKIMAAGLFSSAVLALPRVADSVLATARAHAVPIRASGGGQRENRTERAAAPAGYQPIGLPSGPLPGRTGNHDESEGAAR